MPRRGYRKGISDRKTPRPHVIKSRAVQPPQSGPKRSLLANFNICSGSEQTYALLYGNRRTLCRWRLSPTRSAHQSTIVRSHQDFGLIVANNSVGRLNVS